jgi:hypothetical protein
MCCRAVLPREVVVRGAWKPSLVCMNGETIRRYTAAEALMDPWILNDPAKPWTPEFVQGEIGKLDSSTMQVPDAYTQAEWVAQVKTIASQHAACFAEPEPQTDYFDDDDEDGF